MNAAACDMSMSGLCPSSQNTKTNLNVNLKYWGCENGADDDDDNGDGFGGDDGFGDDDDDDDNGDGFGGDDDSGDGFGDDDDDDDDDNGDGFGGDGGDIFISAFAMAADTCSDGFISLEGEQVLGASSNLVVNVT